MKSNFLKHTLALLIISVIVMSNIAVAETQNTAQSVYESMNQLASACAKGVNEIYGAWHYGVYEAKDYIGDDAVFSFLSDATSFSSRELKDAAKTLGYRDYRLESNWQSCVEVVMCALYTRGDYTAIVEGLEEVKRNMKLLFGTNDYDLLKNYYISVSAYVDFFLNPTGNLREYAETSNNYKSEIRAHQAELDLWYGD